MLLFGTFVYYSLSLSGYKWLNLNAPWISAFPQSDSEQKPVDFYQRRKNTLKGSCDARGWSSAGRDLGVEESLEYHVMAAFRTRVLVCVHVCVLMLTYNRERYFDSIKKWIKKTVQMPLPNRNLTEWICFFCDSGKLEVSGFLSSMPFPHDFAYYTVNAVTVQSL